MSTGTENGMLPTLEECTQTTFLQRTAGASDSPAKTSASQENRRDFKGIARACFSELCTFLDKSQKKRDPIPFSLRMLKICLVLMEDGISPGFSLKWIGGGMMQSGKYSTLKILECHKTEKDVSLLDIIEIPQSEEFSLSKKQQAEFLKRFNAIQAEKV